MVIRNRAGALDLAISAGCATPEAACKRLDLAVPTQSGIGRRELQGSWQALRTEADAIVSVFDTGTK